MTFEKIQIERAIYQGQAKAETVGRTEIVVCKRYTVKWNNEVRT